MSQRSPSISILLPVYNGKHYLATAINSILAQTFDDWELIIVDDASTDQSRQIIEQYRDPRIVLLLNSRNCGIPSSLNRAAKKACGRYLARMDADDICRPERLRKQYEFLESHLEISVCGSWVQSIGGSKRIWRYPQSDELAKSWLIFEPPFAHPTVMFRRDILTQQPLYNEDFIQAQDYELWSRLAKDVKYANLQEVLLDYRVHAQQVGKKQIVRQQELADRIRSMNLELLGVVSIDKDLELHHNLCRRKVSFSLEKLHEVEAWLLRLYRANQENAVFDSRAFGFVLGERWWETCHLACYQGGWVWSVYRKSTLRKFASIAWLDELKFSLRCRLKRPLDG